MSVTTRTTSSPSATSLVSDPAAGSRRRGGWIAAGVAVVVLLALPFFLGTSDLGKLQQVMYYGVAVMSVTLLTGRLGQFSLGQGAYVGIGAYATILFTNAGFDWYLGIVFAALCAGLVGALAGLPALRIQGLGLVLVSLGIAVVFPQIVLRFDDVTGGAAGLLAVNPLPGPSGLSKTVWAYWVLLAVAVVLFLLATTLVNSRTGRSLVAIRDQELATPTLGINVRVTKVLMYTGAGAIGGIAGWMFAVANRFVSPSDFAVAFSINLVLGMIIGGRTGNVVIGPIIGAVFLVYMRDAVPAIGFNPLLTPFIYGIILVLVLYFVPNGASGAIRDAGKWLRRRFSRNRKRNLERVNRGDAR